MDRGRNHNLIVTSGVETFDSGYHTAGFEYYTFNEVGEGPDTCTPHDDMYGTVTVSSSTMSII